MNESFIGLALLAGEVWRERASERVHAPKPFERPAPASWRQSGQRRRACLLWALADSPGSSDVLTQTALHALCLHYHLVFIDFSGHC